MDSIIRLIAKKKNIEESEAKKLVERKIAEFESIIDEKSAEKIVAIESGIEIEEKRAVAFSTLKEIHESKLNPANFIATVARIYAPRTFEKEGRKGKVCNLEIVDSNGKATLVLWNDDARWMEKSKLEKGDVLIIEDAETRNFNPLEVHSGMLTEIRIFEEENAEDERGNAEEKRNDENDSEKKIVSSLPKIEKNSEKKLNELKDGEIADIVARVVEKGELKEFERNGKKGKYLTATLIDSSESAKMRIVFWDYNAESSEKYLKVGEAIRIENVQAKKGNDGIELQANWASHLIINPENHSLKKREEMLKESLPELELRSMKENEKGIIKGKIGKIISAGVENGIMTIEAELIDESAKKPVIFRGNTALDLLGLKRVPKIELKTVIALKEEHLKEMKLEIVARKEKRANIAKYFCEHVISTL